MLISALDPSLLIYQEEHWRNREAHCFDRVRALTLHRRIIRNHSQGIAMSNRLVSIVYQSFPWADNFKHFSELRDLRQFILDDLTRAHYISASEFGEVSLEPDECTCQHVSNPEVTVAWKELLWGCIEDAMSSQFDAQIATWQTPDASPQHKSISLHIDQKGHDEIHDFPLVWDENSWTQRLACQDAWPDLKRCVELYFLSSPAMQNHSGIRDNPVPFTCTDTFWKSVNDLCEPQMRLLLVKALAKRVYGMLDRGLHDEPFRQVRRFRVNLFWRVHYQDLGNEIVLDEFGEHDIGM